MIACEAAVAEASVTRGGTTGDGVDEKWQFRWSIEIVDGSADEEHASAVDGR